MQSMSRERAAKELRISPTASPEARRRAYRKRMKAVHPDRGGSQADAANANLALEALEKNELAARAQALVEFAQSQLEDRRTNETERQLQARSRRRLKTTPIFVSTSVLSALTTLLSALATYVRAVESHYAEFTTALPILTGVWVLVVWCRRTWADDSRSDPAVRRRELARIAPAHLCSGDLLNVNTAIANYLAERKGFLRLYDYVVRWIGYSYPEYYLLLANECARDGKELLIACPSSEDSGADVVYTLNCNLSAEQERFAIRRRLFSHWTHGTLIAVLQGAVVTSLVTGGMYSYGGTWPSPLIPTAVFVAVAMLFLGIVWCARNSGVFASTANEQGVTLPEGPRTQDS